MLGIVDPINVSKSYAEDTEWRNRDQFINGRGEVVRFLSQKWGKELDYKLKKDLWAFTDNRIAVKFEYEFHDAPRQWYSAYGNENREFNANGLMKKDMHQLIIFQLI